ncbi:MAG: IS481 family transposase, partial [Thermoplasmata archaeon]|nr:IS481 family transposase [Euryarchaeota archaeon]
MAKLTQKKINWIIKQKENRVSSSEISRIMNITPRYVNMIYRKYRLEGNVELKNPGRKKDPISEEMKTMVYETRKEHPGIGALSIEKNLKEIGVKISHNKIHEILKEGGMVMENMNKKKQRKWVRWEREHSN